MFSFNNICFLCLDSINNLQSILFQDEDGIAIEEKMKYILTELLHFKPEKPKYICADCLKCLNSAYKFRQKCIRNLTSLQIYMKDKITNKHFSSQTKDNFTQESHNTANTSGYNSKNEANQNLMHQIQTINDLNTDVAIKTEKQDTDDELEDGSSSFNHHTGNFDKVFIKQENDNDCRTNYGAPVTDDTTSVANNIGEKHLEDKIIKEEFEDNEIDIKENPLLLEETQPKDISLNEISVDDAVSDVSLELTAAVDPKKPYQCDDCQKTYSHYVSLYRHKRTHTGDKPHKCDICNKAFYRKSILTDHKRTHTVEKPNKSIDSQTRPYKCNICGRSFTSSIQLEKHVPVHTGDTSFKCDICDLNFVSKHHLNSHNQTHTNERPYKCDICEVTYKSANGLKEHMIKHTGENPV